ncbi:MAG TPA: DUF5680 domain-containing protein [Patescibacteria group bacterium]|nr:DUF5680 domain-containing protein [Patescibacteria group bacterium]
MNNPLPFTFDSLFSFINKAGKATWAGDGKEIEAERKDFHEFEYKEGKFYYRDSYVGNFKSRGMEVVRHNDKPVWSALYGGGMITGKEDIADHTFNFLKKAMSADEENFQSFRGPHSFTYGDWKYSYAQEGAVEEFSGYEKIYYKNELVFFHRIIGGMII